ncbi:MAG: hypothetical protein ACLVKO_06935 [Dysgonomonas sp.]
MNIYKPTDLQNPNKEEIFLSVNVSDQSYRYKTIMSDNHMMLYFSLPYYIEIPVGCYIKFRRDGMDNENDGLAEYYYLLRPQNVTKVHTQNWEYTVLFESEQYLLQTRRFKFFTVNEKGEHGNYRLKGWYTGTPKEFLELIVRNMNDGDIGWELGTWVEDKQRQTLEYSGENCLEFLQKVADAFKTEWSVAGRIISLGKVEAANEAPVDLSYGYEGGLKSGVKRELGDTEVINRLYVIGTERNIFQKDYGSKTLHMPAGYAIWYDGKEFKTDSEAGDEYRKKAVRYITDENGMYLERSDKPENERIVENILENTDIYPMREGNVTSVKGYNDAKSLYTFTDSQNDIDYKQYILPDLQATIVFQTGMLAGKEFDLYSYKHETKEFGILPIQENERTYPDDIFRPKEPQGDEKGDTYAVFNMNLPDEYVKEAEINLLKFAVEFFHEESRPKFAITGELSGIYAKKNWEILKNKLDVGHYVSLSDPEFMKEPEEIRIVGIKDFINSPMKPQIEFSNEVRKNSWGTMMSNVRDTDNKINHANSDNMAATRRMWRDVKETLNMMYDPEGNYFNEYINPLYVQTMQLVTGSDSLQFCFLDKKGTQTDFATPDYSFEGKTVNMANNIDYTLRHLTIGITDKESGEALENTMMPKPESGQEDKRKFREWLITHVEGGQTPNGSVILLDDAKPFYLYAKCPVGGDTGTYCFSTSSKKLIETEDGTQYYYFWIGILNSEHDRVRSWRTMYGFTEILPGQITVDKIMNSNAESYWDMANNRFRMGNSKSSIEWNIINELLRINNASLEIKDENGDAVASIDGKTGSAVFGKGNILLNSDGSACFGKNKNILKSNGAGSLANGSLSWDSDGNLSVSGKLTAGDNSKIGGMTIKGDALYGNSASFFSSEVFGEDSSIIENIEKRQNYILYAPYTDENEYRLIFLPSISTYFNNDFIIRIIVKYDSGAKFLIIPASNMGHNPTYLRNNNGEIYKSGVPLDSPFIGNGGIGMTKGNIVELYFNNGNYYLLNHKY